MNNKNRKSDIMFPARYGNNSPVGDKIDYKKEAEELLNTMDPKVNLQSFESLQWYKNMSPDVLENLVKTVQYEQYIDTSYSK